METMDYEEYSLQIEGIEKKLGVIRENSPYYSDRESEFAQEKISQYHNVIIEGTDELWNAKYNTINGVLAFPFNCISAKIKGKSVKKTAYNIAKPQGLHIYRFEDTDDKLYSLPQKGCFLGLDLLCYRIPLTMGLMTVMLKINKEKDASESYKKINDFMYNRGKRNKLMADKTYSILKKQDNLLAVCNKEESIGLLNNIKKHVHLEKVRESTV